MNVRRYALGFTIPPEAITALTEISKTAVETAPSIVTAATEAARKKAAKKKAKKKVAAKAEAPVEAPAPVAQKPAVPAWAWPAGALAVVLAAAVLLRPATPVAAPVAASEQVSAAKKNPKKCRSRK